MAEYWVDPANGSDAAAGTEAAPWRLIPGQSGANSVAANDIINIKNGTTSTGGTITPGANGLTYRGYGVASNVLVLTLPTADPRRLQQVRVVRQAGVHEGMWKLDMTGVSGVGVSIGNTRSGVVIEDMHAFNNTGTPGTNPMVRFGTSAATSSDPGFTLRRFLIEGSIGAGIVINKFDPTIEWGKIKYTVSDNIICNATTTNSDRSGSTDTFRYLDLEYPNYGASGVPLGDGDGDNLQTVPNTSTGIYAGRVTISNFYCVKGSVDATWPGSFGGKQSVLVHDAVNGVRVTNGHFYGATSDAQIGILMGTVRGNLVLQNLYFGGYNSGLQTIRLQPGSNPIGTDMIAAGGTVTIRNVVNAAVTKSAFFSCAEDAVLGMNGTLTIENCTVRCTYVAGYSYDADVSLQGGQVTYGANFKLNLRNNIFDTTAIKLKMPTGTAGDADYAVKNNWFRPSTSFYIGSTEYTSLTAFAAAHNAATGNLDGDLELDAVTLLPETVASPQVGAGTHVEYRRDAQGVQRYNPPCQGAYEFLRDRGVR